MMEHSEIKALLPAYVDQELGIADALSLQRHLEGCADCRQEYDQQLALSRRVRAQASYFSAPAGLEARIHQALPVARSSSATTSRWQSRGPVNWLRMGSVLATLLAATWSIGFFLSLPSPQERMAEEVIASHVRSLQADHLTDVASTDQHTVKPWFNGKLSFSPPVIDLAGQGFALEGGRLDYLDGHPVAALIYRHQKHPINLYIWPTNARDAAPQAQASRGYHLVRWSSDDMSYWAVSDVGESELLRFSGILRLAAHQ